MDWPYYHYYTDFRIGDFRPPLRPSHTFPGDLPGMAEQEFNYEGITNQRMINAFAKVFGYTFWEKIDDCELEYMAEKVMRPALYNGPALEDLPLGEWWVDRIKDVLR